MSTPQKCPPTRHYLQTTSDNRLYGTRVSAAGHLAAPESDDLLLPRGAIEAACRRLRRLRMAILRREPPQRQPAVVVRHGRLRKSRHHAQALRWGHQRRRMSDRHLTQATRWTVPGG